MASVTVPYSAPRRSAYGRTPFDLGEASETDGPRSQGYELARARWNSAWNEVTPGDRAAEAPVAPTRLRLRTGAP